LAPQPPQRLKVVGFVVSLASVEVFVVVFVVELVGEEEIAEALLVDTVAVEEVVVVVVASGGGGRDFCFVGSSFLHWDQFKHSVNCFGGFGT
jgi:hypothetical protein